MRAQFNGDGNSWTIESNGKVGCTTTTGANNNEGPGGGEYYWGDYSLYSQPPGSAYHVDATQGGIALLPADGKVISTGIDPSTTIYSGGVWALNNATGARDNGYAVYKQDPGTFGKASGLGDIEALCDLPPLQIGNYVWNDTDRDGVQDPNEAGMQGVNVSLYNANGNLVASKVTDSNGEYYFSSTDGLNPNTKYFVVVGTGGQFSNGKLNAGGANNNLALTQPFTGEGANPQLNDSNGTLAGSGVVPNNSFQGYPFAMIMTGPEGFVDHTLDFGFNTCNMSVTLTKVDSKCEQNNGSASANPTSGVSPYSYKWSNAGITKTIPNLGAGTYTVTVTDAVLCTAVASVTLVNQPSPAVSISKVDATCDANNGTATANGLGGSPGFTYIWSNGSTSQTTNSLTPGTYTVTITDQNGCTASASTTILNFTKPTATVVEEVIPEELNITMKQIDVIENTTSTFENISPMDMTIQESMKLRTEERRKKLKEFNYKFHNNISKIDELEKEPAYKRLGIDISKPPVNSTNSRISVGTDSNDDLQLRSNNSYLHDNVD